jgi:phage gpG-like protein
MAGGTPGIRAEVFGDKHLMATMNSWAMRAGHAQPAYESMHQYTMEIERELFETAGASGEHGAWEGHVEGSRAAKNDLMQASGDLFNSLTEANDPNHRFVITPYGFAMGTALKYSEFHQTGTSRMPQRRLFDFTWPQRMGFVEIMHMWITRAGLAPAGQAAGFRVRSTRVGRFIG